MVPQVSKALYQKLALLSIKFPELIPEELTNVHSLVRKFVSWKNPKCAVGRKISSFQQELGTIDSRSGNFIYSKGCGGEGVLQTILESFSAKNQSETGATVFKTQELSIDKEIMKILDKGAIKNME